MNGNLGLVERVLGQVRRMPKELSISLDINWHRTVGNHVDLFRIMAFAILPTMHPRSCISFAANI